MDKDQIGEGQGGEKVVSTLMSKNQNSDIASFERKFTEGNQREMRKDESNYTESVANTGQKEILISSIGTAMGKVEIKPVEKSQPVVRGSSIDLQSKLRDLMKCGSSINTTNPFAPKKTAIPPPQLQQQQQQQQGDYQRDCFIKCNVTSEFFITADVVIFFFFFLKPQNLKNNKLFFVQFILFYKYFWVCVVRMRTAY